MNRRMIKPPLHRSAEEVSEALQEISIYLIQNENVLFISVFDKSIAVFLCLTIIQHLYKSVKINLEWIFNCCTEYIFQLFTFHLILNGHYIPLKF